MDVVMDDAFCGRVGLYRKPLGPKYGWSGQQQCREPDCGAANHHSFVLGPCWTTFGLRLLVIAALCQRRL